MEQNETGIATCPHCQKQFEWSTPMIRHRISDGGLAPVSVIKDRIVEIQLDSKNIRYFSTECPKCGKWIEHYQI